MDKIIATHSWLVCASCGRSWDMSDDAARLRAKNQIHAFAVYYAVSGSASGIEVAFCSEQCQRAYESAHPDVVLTDFKWLW